MEEAARLEARLAAPATAPATKWKVPARASPNTPWSRQWECLIAGGQPSSAQILVDSWVFYLKVVLMRLKWIETDSQIVLDSSPQIVGISMNEPINQSSKFPKITILLSWSRPNLDFLSFAGKSEMDKTDAKKEVSSSMFRLRGGTVKYVIIFHLF